MAGEIVKVDFNSFAIAQVEQTDLAQLLRDNIGPRGIDEFDLPRVRIPAGGGIAWELASADGSGFDAEKEFDAIILLAKDARRYWSTPYSSGAGTPPDCYSLDAIHGIGEPAEACDGLCDKCQFAQFGTAIKDDGSQGRGQACRLVKMLYIMRPDELLPQVVVLPPTSLKAARAYLLRLVSSMRQAHSVITRFRLEKDKSADGISYSRCEMQRVGDLSPEDLKVVTAYRDAILPGLQRMKPVDADFREPSDASAA